MANNPGRSAETISNNEPRLPLIFMKLTRVGVLKCFSRFEIGWIFICVNVFSVNVFSVNVFVIE